MKCVSVSGWVQGEVHGADHRGEPEAQDGRVPRQEGQVRYLTSLSLKEIFFKEAFENKSEKISLNAN